MPDIYFKSVPFSKEDVTLALESGVDGIITEAEHVEGVRSLALCDVRAEADMPSVGLGSKAEEESIASRIAGGERLVLAQGWEIIPVENLLAQPAVAGKLAVEVASLAEARLAAGVLECGVPVVVVLPEALASLKNIVSELKLSQGTLTLDKATITEVKTVGLGHRVLRRYADPHGAGAGDAGGQLQRLHLPYARRNGAQRICGGAAFPHQRGRRARLCGDARRQDLLRGRIALRGRSPYRG